MEKNEIKKLLYKQNPIAALKYIRKGIAYYHATVEQGEKCFTVNFEIPTEDMGAADFFPQMESKLLNRWILTEDTVS